jgi:non-ribosomal peptide synthase protein (TIGR01720 family)
VKAVKEQLRAVPAKGLGYGVLRYLSSDPDVRRRLAALAQPQLGFNYLGQFSSGAGWSPLEPTAPELGPAGLRAHLIDVDGGVVDGQLQRPRPRQPGRSGPPPLPARRHRPPAPPPA